MHWYTDDNSGIDFDLEEYLTITIVPGITCEVIPNPDITHFDCLVGRLDQIPKG